MKNLHLQRLPKSGRSHSLQSRSDGKNSESESDMLMATGFTRVIRKEAEGLKLVTLTVKQDLPDHSAVLQAISGILKVSFIKQRDRICELEYQYNNNAIVVPRLRVAPHYERWSQGKTAQNGGAAVTEELALVLERPLKLEVEVPGLLSSMHFTDDGPRTPLGTHEVEVQAKSYGVNSNGVEMASGHLSEGQTNGPTWISEWAGVISAVGTGLSNQWKVGDQLREGHKSSIQALDGKNATFTSLGLGLLIRQRPEIVGKAMDKVIDLINDGKISSIHSTQSLPISQIETAFRLVSKGQMTGKVVLEVNDGAIVRATVPKPAELTIMAGATYVVPGGLGSLGEKICVWLAAHGAKHIVALNRSGTTRYAQDVVALEAELEKHAAKLYRPVCDVTDEARVRQVSTWCAANLPPVQGIIQSAASFVDKVLENMTGQNFNQGVRPKRDGTINVYNAFASDQLEHVVLLSSAAGVLGSKGQTHYNTGNAFQEGFGLQKVAEQATSGLKTHFTVIQPALITGSDADVTGARRKKMFHRQGGVMVTFSEVLALIEYSMGEQARQDGYTQLIMGVDPSAIADDGTFNIRFVNDIIQTQTGIEAAADETGAPRAVGTASVGQMLLAVASNQEEMHKVVVEAIANRIRELVAISGDDLGPGIPLVEFGVDSLVAIELKNWIGRELEASLQTSQILDAPSITSLAAIVVEKSTIANKQAHGSEVNGVNGDAPNAVGHNGAQETGDGSAEAAPSHGHKYPTIDNWLFEPANEQVYTGRNYPLSPWGGMPGPDAFSKFPHRQAERAAIVSLSALKLKRNLEAVNMKRTVFGGRPQCTYMHSWLFNTYREPVDGVDRMHKMPANEYIAVLRKGHMFRVDPMDANGEFNPFVKLEAAFQAIINKDVGTDTWESILTADDRNSWARVEIRQSAIEAHPDNKRYLDIVEGAVFLVCLDEAAPTNSEERMDSMLLNKGFNRWYDKGLKLIVCSNGVSGMHVDHSMIDGTTIREMYEAHTKAIESYQRDDTNNQMANDEAVQLEQYTFHTSPDILDRIGHIRERYVTEISTIGFTQWTCNRFGQDYFQSIRVPAKCIYETIV
ncbi:hypothetical protein NW767_015005 [Fusarium falciforme]|nr:hypothetical protein NW767_015005 [Fusarium falciforme]